MQSKTRMVPATTEIRIDDRRRIFGTAMELRLLELLAVATGYDSAGECLLALLNRGVSASRASNVVELRRATR